MTAGIPPLTQRSAWKALAAHYAAYKDIHLRQLFADDPARGSRLTLEAVGIYFDYSKNRVTDETLRLLVQLAEESGVARRRDTMFAGERINTTENRAVLHVALRAPRGASIVVDGENVVPKVHAVLDQMARSRRRRRIDAPRAARLRLRLRVKRSDIVRSTSRSVRRPPCPTL